MTDGRSPGFFGKLPSRADFVTRRLAADFVARWDPWLRGVVAAGHAALGEQWLEAYLTSPIWRFAVSPGVCGAEAHLGVLIPSVDKVGRYFPLTAAAVCEPHTPALAGAFALEAWFSEVEDLLLETLGDPPLAFEVFDERLVRLRAISPPAPNDALVRGAGRCGGSHPFWHCSVSRGGALGELLAPLSSAVLAERLERYAVWWTEGSERVAPCVLIGADLPEPEVAVAMLDGRFADRGWTSTALPRFDRRGRSRASRRARSAAMTDAGKVRAANEDSYAASDEIGVWLVADGLGGHEAGDAASQMVASAVGHLFSAHDLRERIEQLTRALAVVNDCLVVLAARDPAIRLTASTVAALLIEGDTAVAVWAGDSRVYRLRGGELAQLTRDHSDSNGSGEARAVTRAVGGTERLDLEIVRGEVRPGDRYLLCTDGVYGEVADSELAAALGLAEPNLACEELKRTILSGAARDNLTAIVVYVGEDPERGR